MCDKQKRAEYKESECECKTQEKRESGASGSYLESNLAILGDIDINMGLVLHIVRPAYLVLCLLR